MLIRISQLVSLLFIPLAMPLLGLYLAMRFDPYMALFLSPEKSRLTLIVVGMATLLFPLINLYILRRFGVITSYWLRDRKERIAPAISTILYFGLGYFLIQKGYLPTALYSLYLGALFSAVLAMLISLKWKISLHAIGISGVVGGMYGLFKLHEFVNWPLLFALIIVAGWVMTARMALDAHTPAQVYAGAALGFTVTFLCVVMGVVI